MSTEKLMQQLEQPLKDFVREVCRYYQQSQVPQQAWTRIIHQNNAISFPTELRQDFLSIIKSDNLIQMHSADRLFNIIKDDEELAKFLFVDGSNKRVSNVAAQQIVLPSLLRFITGNYVSLNGFNYDDASFSNMFTQVISPLLSEKIKSTWLSPLLNIEFEADHIDITEHVRIRRLSTQEVEQWLNSSQEIGFWPMLPFEIANLQYVIEIVYQYNKSDVDNFVDVSQDIGRVVNLLRLITNRKIHTAFTESYSEGLIWPSSSWSRPDALRLGDELAVIDRQQGELVKSLWDRLDRSPNAAKISLALRRWDSAVERLSDEDKIIDYWIALESLFTSDTTQEIKFRASLRIAGLLGANVDEREKIYNEIRHSYDWRSKIVHGTDTVKNSKSLKDFKKKGDLPEVVEKTRSYLRQALLHFLKSDTQIMADQLELQLLRR